MNKIICLYCGSEITNKSKYCMACGKKVCEFINEIKPEFEKKCFYCNEKNNSNSNYCFFCGKYIYFKSQNDFHKDFFKIVDISLYNEVKDVIKFYQSIGFDVEKSQESLKQLEKYLKSEYFCLLSDFTKIVKLAYKKYDTQDYNLNKDINLHKNIKAIEYIINKIKENYRCVDFSFSSDYVSENKCFLLLYRSIFSDFIVNLGNKSEVKLVTICISILGYNL